MAGGTAGPVVDGVLDDDGVPVATGLVDRVADAGQPGRAQPAPVGGAVVGRLVPGERGHRQAAVPTAASSNTPASPVTNIAAAGSVNMWESGSSSTRPTTPVRPRRSPRATGSGPG